MLLAAKALGYDSLWAGIKWQSDFYSHLISYFHLPEGFIPVTVLSFGKPGEKKVQVDRYDEKKVHLGKF
jgi:nitroreductase